MARQLDILALEPFFGGIRRNMLETLVLTSRHRWTLMTLPPRRMERRLAAAAHWFAEQIARRDIGPTDLLFTCDALNLADLYRLCPSVADQPSVVYFHCNQLPDPAHLQLTDPGDLTHLNTATAASEIWFNSKYHAGAFVDGLESLVSRHAELQMRNPVDSIREKMSLVPPPVDLSRLIDLSESTAVQRDPTLVFVESRDANIELLNAALEILHQLKRKMTLLISGPTDLISTLFPRRVIGDNDAAEQVRGLLSAGIFLSTRIAAPFDENAVRALHLGCQPVLPHSGVYPELLPSRTHGQCLYDMSAESLASHLHEALYGIALHRQTDLTVKLECFDPIKACHLIDEKLDQLVGMHLQASTVRVARRARSLSGHG